jgi:hypothetical protein
VALGQNFLQYFGVTLSRSCHQCSILIHSSITDAFMIYAINSFATSCTSTLMREAVYSSESIAHIYQTTRFHSTEDRDIQFDRHKILKPRRTINGRLSKTLVILALNSKGAERHLWMASGRKVLPGRRWSRASTVTNR